MKFVSSRKGIFLHLQKYDEDILKKFYMRSCNSGITRMKKDINLSKDTNDEFVDATLYKKIIGSLRYMFNTSPNICQSAGLVSRVTDKSRTCHILVTKVILRYIKDTVRHGVLIRTIRTLAKKQEHMIILIQIGEKIKMVEKVLQIIYL